MPYTIKSFEFPDAAANVAAAYHGTNWPVVYLIHNDEEIYVGETTSAYSRYLQHADKNGKNWKYRKRLTAIEIIFDDFFHKSAILDLEQSLIKLIETDNAIEKSNKRHSFTLQNKNGGQSNQHDYYNRKKYQNQLEVIWEDLRRRKLAANSFSTITNSDIFKYSPYNCLTSEQEAVCQDIIRDTMRCLLGNTPGTAILKGSAGTGKSIVMINMISTLVRCLDVNYDFDPTADEDIELNERLKLHEELVKFFAEWKKRTGQPKLKIGFVVPMRSIRSTFQAVFTASEGLTGNMVITPNQVVTKPDKREYDVVFIDEAHRLKRRRAMSGTEMGDFDDCCNRIGIDKESGSQLDFILNKTKYQVMVYDANQTVKSSDIPVDVFWKKLGDRHIIERELRSQMRCKGGGEYIQYIDDIFHCTASEKKEMSDFEFMLYDDPNQLIDFIVQSDRKEHLCRTVAGYAWEWVSSKEKVVKTTKKGPDTKYRSSKKKFKDIYALLADGRDPDIDLNGKKYYWNVNADRWILNSSPEEIGCIHTTQGYDLNKVGVIFGPEIDYNPTTNQIVIDRSKFFDTKVKEKTDDTTLRKYIINSYKVMMARGIHGCYVYACNPNMQKYLSRFIDKAE